MMASAPPASSSPIAQTQMTSVGSTTPSPGSHEFLHRKPRFGNPRTTKLYYDPTEKAFTEHDMTQQGRLARLEVEHMLASSPFSAHPAWNSSTLPSLTALEVATHSDNLHYASVHTAHLVQRAQRRMRLIRSGQDPDLDPRDIQPRWNVSCKMEEEERRKADAEWRERGRGRDPAEGYEGLLERERRWEHYQRKEKAERELNQQREDERKSHWRDWERKEQWNAGPLPIIILPQPTAVPRPRTADFSPRHSAARLSQHLASIAPPAPASASPHPLLAATVAAPYAVYSHPGHYGWVDEGRRAWSCCHCGVETARGCVVVGERKEKRRLLPVGVSAAKEAGGRGRVVRYEHSGVWQPSLDGVSQWSCCSMEDKDGRGCVARTIVQEHRWNLVD